MRKILQPYLECDPERVLGSPVLRAVLQGATAVPPHVPGHLASTNTTGCRELSQTLLLICHSAGGDTVRIELGTAGWGCSGWVSLTQG